MTTPAQAITALRAQLQDSDNLSYIKKVYDGVRKDNTLLPCIVLEADENNETFTGYPIVNLVFRGFIFCFIQVHNKDKQLVGDTKTKGILDVENDIKKAIGEDFTLGGVVETVNFGRTIYDQRYYPRRAVVLEAHIEFKQNVNTRT